MIILWIYIHSIMFAVLAIINMFMEIMSVCKEISVSEKSLNYKKDYYIGEKIMMLIIILAVAITIGLIGINFLCKNKTVAVWFCGIFGVVYTYMAVKQIIKIIFVSENRVFSYSDIKDFTYTYMIWWLIVLAVGSIKLGSRELDRILITHEEIVQVGMLFLWYYFNILYVLGGLYIFLYYLWKVVEKVAVKISFNGEKMRKIINRICNLLEQGEKYNGLSSFRLWKENNRKCAAYKIFLFILLLMFDICSIIYLLTKYFVRITFLFIVVLICDPIRVIYMYTKNLWSRHKNNEWMYLFAQIAGLISYVIVFLTVQYGEYEEVTIKVYEFVGTIVLIPYFISKIMSVNKNVNGNEPKANVEKES